MAELRSLVQRSREVVVVAAVTGALTGLGVVLFAELADRALFERVLDAPAAVQVAAPLVGLALAAAAIRWLTGSSGTATTDEYIDAMQGPRAPFALRPVVGRLMASLSTLGFGGAMGYEGPSIYLGTGAGAALHQRLGRRLRNVDRHVLLAAGAAAGVAAIFKAPATGAVFALEVPYQDDLARGALLPALVGAASGYTVFVSFNGTSPLFPVAGAPPIDLRDLAGAAAVGLACGIGARVYAAAIVLAKRASGWGRQNVRVLVGGLLLGGLVVASRAAFDGQPLSLGPGYEAVDFALDPDRALVVVAGLATIRVVATMITVGAGGVGGLFVPLVVQGALTGRLIGGVIGGPHQSLFVVVGIAAFLGAGYRVPLAAVMFVAETTGHPGFVVPGLLAAVMAQLLMGDASISTRQRRRHAGHIEERARLPIAQALTTDPATSAPDDTLAQFFSEHVSLARRRAVPVVSDGRYLGMVLLEDVLAVEPERWTAVTVGEVLRDDVPVGRASWTLGAALSAMVSAGADHLAVVSEDGELRGVVTRASILDLQDLLDRLADDQPPDRAP